jgi:hypothetical protein
MSNESNALKASQTQKIDELWLKQHDFIWHGFDWLTYIIDRESEKSWRPNQRLSILNWSIFSQSILDHFEQSVSNSI